MTQSNETMHSENGPPALPLTLVDAILATVPLAARASTPIRTLLNVLSPSRHLPTTLCAALIDAAGVSGELLCFDLTASLAELARRPFDPLFIGRLVPALAREPERLCAVFAREVGGAGRIDTLEYLRTHLPFDLTGCKGLLDAAAANGRLDVLQRWTVGNTLPDAVALTKDGILGAVTRGDLKIVEWIAERDIGLGAFARDVIESGAKAGHVSILEWCRTRAGQLLQGFRFDFTSDDWAEASKHGHITVLNWAKHNALPFPESTEEAIDLAIGQGQLQVLEWWYHESPLPFHYSVWGTRTASKNGHLHVLEWLASSGMEFRFASDAKTIAAKNKHVSVVQWWEKNAQYKYLQSGRHARVETWRGITTDFAMLCSFGQVDLINPSMIPSSDSLAVHEALACAAKGGHIDILVRFKNYFQSCARDSSCSYIREAVAGNQVQVLQWCKTHFGLDRVSKTKWVEFASLACDMGHDAVFDWMYLSNYVDKSAQGELLPAAMGCAQSTMLENLFTKGVVGDVKIDDEIAVAALVSAATKGRAENLRWWVDKKLSFPALVHVVDRASQAGQWLVLEWMCAMQPAVPFVWSEYAIRSAIRAKHKSTCKWWLRSGLVKGLLLRESLEKAVAEMC